MNLPSRVRIGVGGLIFCMAFLLGESRSLAAVAVESPYINSISAEGTNLDFVATFPAGVASAVLEMRPTLTDEWQSTAALDVPAAGGVVNFTIPMPASASAFFRFNVTMQGATNEPVRAQQSTELQFVAVPPLGPDSTNVDEAVFHFQGTIDGSDRIVIRQQGALWEHVHWGWPDGSVNVNGAQWNPSEKNYMATTGAVAFLPEKYDLFSPRLESLAGRDVVALERTNDAVIVYLDDTPNGGAPYEFKIHFPLTKTAEKSVRHSPAATLKVTAAIDGSDLLKITADQATWTHRFWELPGAVKLNDISWDVQETNILANTGTNRFLPAGVDFSTAKIIKREGRDLATMWADKDAIWINFADNPNGGDAYELDISFGN